MASTSTADLSRIVAAQGRQLDGVTGDVHAMRKQFTEFSTATLQALGDLKTAFETQRATRGYDFLEAIGPMMKIAAFLAMIAAGIVYVVKADSSGPVAVTGQTISMLARDYERRQDDERRELADYRRFLRSAPFDRHTRSAPAQ
jgi:hypothetical protein